MTGTDGPQTAQYRKLMIRVRDIGLTDDERYELASYLLRRDITTWKTLDNEQVLRLLDALEGFELVVELLAQRPPVQVSPNSSATAASQT